MVHGMGDTDTTIDWTNHEQIAADIGWPFKDWSHQCHAVSIAIVKHYGIGRVARGTCRGVAGQHSWITLGDPYDPDATIIDPTLWSYVDDVNGIVVTTMTASEHRPHGWANGRTIWQWGVPDSEGGPTIDLTPAKPLSREAEGFLKVCRSAVGSLDRRFWWSLVNQAPLVGWPAREIIEAVYHTDQLSVLIPIDIVGMVTDLNPSGLYLPGTPSD